MNATTMTSPGRGGVTKGGFLLILGCAAVLCGGRAVAGTNTVEWHYVPDHQPTRYFSISPANPNSTSIIHYVAPTDYRVYVNSCLASYTNGTPAITVDSTRQIIRVFFGPPYPQVCPLFVLTVSGVDGQIGPLRSGIWTFQLPNQSFTFKVTRIPPRLSVQSSAAGVFQVSWPVSEDAYVLEARDGLYSGNWQAVTNTILTSGGLNSTQVPAGPGSRLFRLRGL